jgi:hypothetical protein
MPTVTLDATSEPWQITITITIAQACGLVCNCTDIRPEDAVYKIGLGNLCKSRLQ